MEELMLLENPWYGEPRRHSRAAKKGHRGRNPTYIAPYDYYKPSIRQTVSVPGYVKRLPGERNPKGGTMKKSLAGAIPREWTQGVDLMDVGSAVAGLAAAGIIPGMVVTTTATGMQKFLKILTSVGVAFAAGFVFRNVSSSAGKAAVLGGLAGAATQAIGTYTNVQIGRPDVRRLSPPVGGSIRQTTFDEFADVRVS